MVSMVLPPLREGLHRACRSPAKLDRDAPLAHTFMGDHRRDESLHGADHQLALGRPLPLSSARASGEADCGKRRSRHRRSSQAALGSVGARETRGRSGGLLLASCIYDAAHVIRLLQNEREDLTPVQRQALRKIVETEYP